MIAITTSSSTSVKPRRFELKTMLDMEKPPPLRANADRDEK
jgi:hypothetical protein